VTRSLTALGHLGRWMEREHVDVDQLDADAVMAFLAAHVKDQGRLPTAGVLPLLDYLRAEGHVAPESAAPVSALDRLIADYRAWLVGERELAPATVRGYVQSAHRFLAGRVSPDGRLDVKHVRLRLDLRNGSMPSCHKWQPRCKLSRHRQQTNRRLVLVGLTPTTFPALNVLLPGEGLEDPPRCTGIHPDSRGDGWRAARAQDDDLERLEHTLGRVAVVRCSAKHGAARSPLRRPRGVPHGLDR
jgi:hypothetical protein